MPKPSRLADRWWLDLHRQEARNTPGNQRINAHSDQEVDVEGVATISGDRENAVEWQGKGLGERQNKLDKASRRVRGRELEEEAASQENFEDAKNVPYVIDRLTDIVASLTKGLTSGAEGAIAIDRQLIVAVIDDGIDVDVGGLRNGLDPLDDVRFGLGAYHHVCCRAFRIRLMLLIV
jgi:hypothetical protein